MFLTASVKEKLNLEEKKNYLLAIYRENEEINV